MRLVHDRIKKNKKNMECCREDLCILSRGLKMVVDDDDDELYFIR